VNLLNAIFEASAALKRARDIAIDDNNREAAALIQQTAELLNRALVAAVPDRAERAS
jgi:hypothetical protein